MGGAKLDKFHYALLTANLFMSQVPCDARYDKEMAKLLGKVKEAHDEALVLAAASPSITGKPKD